MKAFPASSMKYDNLNGMDLRDYFAAKVLPTLIADYLKDMDWGIDNPYKHFNCATEVAYHIADLMMKAREQ